MPRMFIISGCNGSGKTTASYTLLPEFLDCRDFVNSDEFAKSLSPFDPSAASVSASRYMLMKIQYLMERNQDFCVETTLATRSLRTLIREARKKDYFITVLYFWLDSPDLAVERVKARVKAGGHSIPEDEVRRRYFMGLDYLFNDYMGLCDHWVVADNSNPPFIVVAEGLKGFVDVKDKEKFERIRSLAGLGASSDQ